MMPDNTRRYSQEEVKEILSRALDNHGPSSGAITHDELLETARELGIDPAQLEAAVAEQESVGAIEGAREAWKARQKQEFFEHLRSYLIVNFVLILINLFTGGLGDGNLWFFWPLFGWGIGILFHAAGAFFPKEADIERGARKMLEKQRGKQLKIESKRNGKGGSLTMNSHGKIIIEKGDKRIEIG
jgi:hypothetical protein